MRVRGDARVNAQMVERGSAPAGTDGISSGIEPLSLEEVQRALDVDTSMLAYATGASRSVVWPTNAGEVVVDVPPAASTNTNPLSGRTFIFAVDVEEIRAGEGRGAMKSISDYLTKLDSNDRGPDESAGPPRPSRRCRSARTPANRGRSIRPAAGRTVRHPAGFGWYGRQRQNSAGRSRGRHASLGVDHSWSPASGLGRAATKDGGRLRRSGAASRRRASW